MNLTGRLVSYFHLYKVDLVSQLSFRRSFNNHILFIAAVIRYQKVGRVGLHLNDRPAYFDNCRLIGTCCQVYARSSSECGLMWLARVSLAFKRKRG
jgi:hypothetical protein